MDENKCFDCPVREYYARVFDMHISHLDCPVKCPHDRIERVKENG